MQVVFQNKQMIETLHHEKQAYCTPAGEKQVHEKTPRQTPANFCRSELSMRNLK